MATRRGLSRTYLSLLAKRSLTSSTTNAETSRAKPKLSKELLKKRSELYEKFLRVDHAGEYGADRIYAGQMAVLGRSTFGPIIQEMWDQEKEHLATFERLLPQHRVRPTALLPLWNVAGFVLGAGTALLGKESAMACTVAVESVITDHYNEQIRQLISDNPEDHKELLKIIQQFRDDEQHHHDTGLEHNAEQAPFYSFLTEVIKLGCKGAIKIAEKV